MQEGTQGAPSPRAYIAGIPSCPSHTPTTGYHRSLQKSPIPYTYDPRPTHSGPATLLRLLKPLPPVRTPAWRPPWALSAHLGLESSLFPLRSALQTQTAIPPAA